MNKIKVPKPKNEKARIIHRLKITRGHLTKLIEMVESNIYCIDLITQSLAVRKAVKATEIIILSNHLRTCFKRVASNGISKEQEKVIKEIIDLEDFHE